MVSNLALFFQIHKKNFVSFCSNFETIVTTPAASDSSSFCGYCAGACRGEAESISHFGVLGVQLTCGESGINLLRFNAILQMCLPLLKFQPSYLCWRLRAYMHVHIHTCMHTYVRAYIRIYVHAIIRSCIHTCKHVVWQRGHCLLTSVMCYMCFSRLTAGFAKD